MDRDIFNRVGYRWRLMKMSLMRFNHRFVSVLFPVGAVLDVMGVVAALCCIVSMMLYVGFEHIPSDLLLLKRLIRVAQLILYIGILFRILFRSRHGRRTALQWVVDGLMLLTAVPMVYPEPVHPWIRWLADVVYNHRVDYVIVACYSVIELSYAVMRLPGRRTNPTLMLSASFLIFIIIGALVLMFPKCSYGGIGFIDSLFVSTSAVCITGLTTVDVATTFTPLGLAVLAVLIETGALGVMTFTCFFAVFFTGNTSVYSQLVIRDIIYAKSMANLLPTLMYIFVTTLVVQAIGAVAIFICVPDALMMSFGDKVVFAVFHSISAFCNAGFSNLPGGLANSVLLNSDQSIYWVFSVLIVAGAIGFPIIVNFKDAVTVRFVCIGKRLGHSRWAVEENPKVHLVDMNTKIVIAAFFILFFVGAVMFFIAENDNSLVGMDLWTKVSQSVFNSVTPRSAGFSSVNPAGFLPVTLVMVMFLMWVGGGAQSTAGGVKVNTLAAICLNLHSIVTGRERVTAFRRTVALPSIRRANAVVAVSILSYLLFSLTVLWLEPELSTRDLLFETCSALFTVGSSLGVTPHLGTTTKIVLCAAMFLGRVGIISMLSGVVGRRGPCPRYPDENIIIN